jgi:hypothetical protein
VVAETRAGCASPDRCGRLTRRHARLLHRSVNVNSIGTKTGNRRAILRPRSEPVLPENSIVPSCGSVIVTEESAQTRATLDGTVHTRWNVVFRRNQPIVNALTIPFLVVIRRERGERPAQVAFSEDDDPIQAFLLDGADESLRVRIAVGCLKRCLHDPDAGIGHGPAERRAPFGIPIADQDPLAAQDAFISGGQHTSDLEHERVIRGGDPTRCTRRDSSSMTKAV